MKNLTLILTALWLAALLTTPRPARAGWTNDPFNGMVTVCDTPGEQRFTRTCQLTGGRTIIAWVDMTTGIFYQILDESGHELLPHNGILLVNMPSGWGYFNDDTGIIPDGHGGCIVIFKGGTSSPWDIYGQRIDNIGNRLWGIMGAEIAIWPGTESIYPNDVAFDSLGNFFVSWMVGWSNSDVYAQKFNVNGQRLWGEYGVPVCIQGNWQERIQIIPDNQGGIEAVWGDARPDNWAYHLYFQHLDAGGNPLLTVNGIPLHDMFGNLLPEFYLDGVADGQGGGIWHTLTNSIPNYFNLFRVNSHGQTLWFWHNDTFYEHVPQSLMRHPDGTFWVSVDRAFYESFLYHFDINGNQLLGPLGRPWGGVLSPTSDGIISGKDNPGTPQFSLDAQKVNSSGSVSWISPFVMYNVPNRFYINTSAPDGADGVVFPIGDMRDSTDVWNISAQRVNADGTLGTPNKIKPNPNKNIEMQPGEWPTFIISKAGPVKLDLYDVLGRKVFSRDEGYRQPGPYTIRTEKWNLPSGVYLLKLISTEKEQIKKIVIAH